MKPIDLTKILQKYKSGWVAIDTKHTKIVSHKATFEEISDAINGKKDVYIMPASGDYYGFIT